MRTSLRLLPGGARPTHLRLVPARPPFVRKGSWRRLRGCAPLDFGASVALVPAALAFLLFLGALVGAPSHGAHGHGHASVDGPGFALLPRAALGADSVGGWRYSGAAREPVGGTGAMGDVPAAAAGGSGRGEGAEPPSPEGRPLPVLAPCGGYDSVEAMLAAARST